MEINIIEGIYPQAHEPANEESRSLLIATTGWAWIPWPYLGIFKDVLARKEIYISTVPKAVTTKASLCRFGAEIEGG